MSDEDTEQPIGPVLDALDVTIDLDPEERLTDVIVIGRSMDFENGTAQLVVTGTKHTDWITKLGLFAAAKDMLNMVSIVDDED